MATNPFGDDKKEIAVKVGMIGDAQTGKTSLMVKYVENVFDEDYISSVGVSYKEKSIQYGDAKIVFSIWDLGGNQEYVHMLPLVTNDSLAMIFIFDLTRKATLTAMRDWYRQARQLNTDAKAILVGTKFDLLVEQDAETVESTTTAARKFAKAMKAPLIFVSAKAGINVNKLFKVVLGKITGSDCGVDEVINVGEPILEYKDCE